jgi:hypothetical protein
MHVIVLMLEMIARVKPYEDQSEMCLEEYIFDRVYLLNYPRRDLHFTCASAGFWFWVVLL